MIDTLEAATGPAGQVLLTHQSDHWVNTAASALLLLLRVTGRQCPHAPYADSQPAVETEHPGDSGAHKAFDAIRKPSHGK
ncbi:hypothetical protein ACWDO7_26930 [Streptomyces sp. NPDC003656]